MPIDPRIAMQLQVPDVAGAVRSGLDWHDQREKQKGLADLMPKAAGLGQGAQDAIGQLWAIDPNLALRMDERQREHAKAVTQDLGSAVRWADTPEKWSYVQQHYGGQGVDLSPYRFEDRERGLVALNQISGYLDGAPKQDIRAVEPGGSLYDVAGGKARVLVSPNTGGQQTGAPVQQAGNVPQGAVQMLRSNPGLAAQFDEKYGKGAAAKALGGQTAPPSGSFPY